MTKDRLQCEMRNECTNTVTHIEEKGWIYCADCAQGRKGSGHYCRRLRAWEINLLKSGEPVPSYTPITLSEARRRKLEASHA